MLCQACKKTEATIHLTQVVGNKIRKLDLCEACADKYGVKDPAGFSMIEILKKFSQIIESPIQSSSSHSKECSVCGYTENDIAKTGRVGCAACYAVFNDEIKKTLSSIQKSDTHIGKHPDKLPAEAKIFLDSQEEESSRESAQTNSSSNQKSISKPKNSKGTKSSKANDAKSSSKTSEEIIQTTLGKSAEKKNSTTPSETNSSHIEHQIYIINERLKSHQEMLKEAIKNEDYIYAAKIRDQIKSFKEELQSWKEEAEGNKKKPLRKKQSSSSSRKKKKTE